MAEYVRFGRTGLKVSRFCLGCMTFGSPASQEESFAIMDYAYEQGCNFLDVANSYNGGKSEEVVGRWLSARGLRHKIVLASKVFSRMGEGPNEAGSSRYAILQQVEGSLRRLNVDAIDLYQVHFWDAETPIEETLDVLNDLVHQGKVRYIGASNFTGWQLCKSLWVSSERHLARFESLQPMYNLLKRQIEAEILPLCQDQQVAVIPYNPLAGGFLTGKYNIAQSAPAGTRLGDSDYYNNRYWSGRNLQIAGQFVAIAAEMGVTPAQLALAWVLGHPAITSAIVGARTPDQLRDSLGGLSLHLTSEQRQRLTTLTEVDAPPLTYHEARSRA